MDNILRGLRHSLRALKRNPGFTVVAVATLALGIGATTAIFTVVHGVLLKPLPYAEPERIVVVEESNPEQGLPRFPASPLNYRDFRDQNRTFEALAALVNANLSLTGDGEPELLRGARVSAEYFRVMGREASLGRVIGPEDVGPGAEKVVVLSHALWASRFGADPAIRGRRLELNGESHTVVGVMPPGFVPERELFLPLTLSYEAIPRGAHFLAVLGRLRPDVTLEQAREDLATVAARLAAEYPETNAGWSVVIGRLHDRTVENARTALVVLQGAVVLVLLIACANVANLLLARLAGREREMALRAALGAGRGRLAGQLLAESLVLALLGGAAGTLLAYWGTRSLVALNAAGIPRSEEIVIDGRVLAFTLATSLVTGLVFGLLPAVRAARPDLAGALKEGERGPASAAGGAFVRGLLVFGQVAVALVLLTLAGLLLRSFDRLLAVEPGFDPEDALTLTLTLPNPAYADSAAQVAFFEQLFRGLENLPGAESAAGIFPMPLTGRGYMLNFYLAGRAPPEPNKEPVANIRFVSPGYFRTMDIPLRGRDFTFHDGVEAPRVVLVNESAAELFWPGEDPIGQTLTFDRPDAEDAVWATVIGVVGDVHHEELSAATDPEIYRAVLQQPARTTTVVLRSSHAGPTGLTGAAREVVRELDPNLPLYEVRTLREIVASSVAEPRFRTSLLGLFAALALVLAAVGVYGLLSCSVAERRREIGVRLALGAGRRQVLGLTVRRGMLPVVIGLGAGLLGSVAAVRLVESLVFEVSTSDPATFVAVPLVLAATAAAACALPASRATRIDPMSVLREE